MAQLPISDFLRARLKEFDPKFELRPGSAFEQLFFKPLQYIMQPLRDEADEIFIGQSFRRILATEDPDAFNEEAVDDLCANVFVYRNQGGKSAGVARVYFDEPVNREYPANGFTAVGNNSKNYTNPAPFAITESQMSAQIEDGLYYFDIPVVSEDLGKDTELDVGALVSVVGDPDVVSIANKAALRGGADREKNTQLIERARNSIAVRDLVTGKGFAATLFENFPQSVVELQAIGFGDDEMMRDIVFNTHIGGKHDGYVKTPNVQVASKDFVGLLIDSTRATKTTTQLEAVGELPIFLGETNIDRTVADPVVTEVKAATAAVFTSSVDLTAPADLTNNQYAKITIDSDTREVRLVGTVPSQTRRSEIINAINTAFGVNVAFAHDNTIRLVSPTKGKNSYIKIEDPALPRTSALIPVFGDPFPETEFEVRGDGPIVFIESVHYTFNDAEGEIIRKVPSLFKIPQGSSLGTLTSGSDLLTTTFAGLFLTITADDIVTVVSGANAGDYRVVEKIDDETLRLDAVIATTQVVDGQYYIKEPHIKDGELLLVEWYFNPLSIDIGNLVKLDSDGKTRGIRPGREDYTISDTAFLRVLSIEVIDPVTLEPLGQVLEGRGGFGLGGFGEESFGFGSGSEYRMMVNEPTARFSAFEDSYLVIASGYQGFSLRVTYEYVPEIVTLHEFCRSDRERVLDGDILIKHFIPGYVSANIEYEVDPTDSTIPSNDELTELVKGFINTRKAGVPLQASDIAQFILKSVDPFFRYSGTVKPFSMRCEFHNTDGSTTVIEDAVQLVVPKEEPFPKETTRPLSPRIAHWMADEIILTRLN